jgi:hypothetical protein
MTYTYTRQAWQLPSQPVTGPAINWSTIDTVVIHYTASKDCPEGNDGAKYTAFMISMQNDYLTNRKYSLGYSVAVSTIGESWEIRGVDIKPAATLNHNSHTYAILITVDGGNAASPAAVAEVRRLIADAERRAGKRLLIKGHGDFAATSCPGVGIRAQIAANVFNPVQPTPPPKPEPIPTPEDIDMQAATLWRDSRYLNVFLIGSCPATNVSPLVFADLVKRGVPVIVERHDQLLATCLNQSGLSKADLVLAG